MDVVPVRLRARWSDDGLPVELWSDDGTVGLRLDVARTSEDPPTVMEVRRIGGGPEPQSRSAVWADEGVKPFFRDEAAEQEHRRAEFRRLYGEE
jgi:hypothetical protein